MNTYVFVYGSLKKKHHNYKLLQNSEFINNATTSELYNMINLGGFPAIIPDNNGYKISGELYLVNDKTLYNLDILEGEGSFYKRIKQKVITSDEIIFESYLYILEYKPSHYNYSNISLNELDILTYERIDC
jgi:gamma-glutamylcyclotransferase (GGCT)/AIG2-like uncharacterized protein YtfP